LIKNYFRIAWRNLITNKGFTLINIIGLSVGIAAVFLIMLYVFNQLGYDKYNVNADRIYRITENVKLNGRAASYAGTEKPLKDALSAIPEIEKTTMLVPATSLFITPQKFFVKKGNISIEEKKVVFTESDLFDVFTLPMIYGNHATSLDEPDCAVITESTAKKYFNRVDVVGKTIAINDSNVYKITGVIKDIPSQSHFHYDFFLSFSSIPESKSDSWGYSGIYNYILVKPGANIHQLQQKIREIELKHYPQAMTKDGNYLNIKLTPLLDIHLRSDTQNELEPGGNIEYVYILLSIALFILLIACVNFINLSTARSANRAKEVGVRKVLGSARQYLIFQFLTESVLVTLISTFVSLILVSLMIPLFNQMGDTNLALSTTSLTWIVPALLGIVLVIGLLAGAYPAFYLSGFKPMQVLKGKKAAGFKNSFLRGFLVVFQFSISIFLIISTLVIYDQLTYIHDKNLGFNRSHELVIKNTNLLGKQAKIFKQELQQIPGVEDATMSTYLPTGQERNITGLFPQLPIDISQDVLSQFWPVDEDYLKTLGIQIIAGRNFSNQMASDSSAIIVNEAFVKKFGFKNPLNKIVYRDSYGIQSYHIIGIVKNFNFSSLKDNIQPLALVYGEDNGAVTARIKTTNLPALLARVKDKWKDISSGEQFTYTFMDGEFDATYRSERHMQQIFFSFSVLAILIACLGLFGLATYAAEQRNKEIAIRKVIGASTFSIINILSTDFIKLIGLSIIIASPVGWFAMNKWLQSFAYRIHISWWVFVLVGMIAVAIALLTVSFQAIKAALANPVNSLRTE
jgi:putative ABC transport system permease protein